MKSLNYWQQFLGSGSIEDYLTYIDREKPADGGKEQQADHLGVNPYEGVHMCDRNDFKTVAYRGI